MEDLNYLFHRQQVEHARAKSALCASSRASHKALSAAYLDRIALYRERSEIH